MDRCVCPMCRYVWNGRTVRSKDPSFNGDRILVSKFAYEFDDPQRWDVIVFKFPGKAQDNYIKRLIGLPGETVRMQPRRHLDSRRRARKTAISRSPESRRKSSWPCCSRCSTTICMPRIEKIGKGGWPVRWQPDLAADGSTAGQWTSADHAVYETDGTAQGEAWLRYAAPGSVSQAMEGSRAGRFPRCRSDQTAIDHRLHRLRCGQ